MATCLLPDTTLDEALQRDYDMVVLPGGAKVAGRLGRCARVGAARAHGRGRHTAAICVAPRVLARSPAGQAGHRLSGILQGMALSDVTVRNTGLERGRR
jgi:protein deglycase